MELYDFTAFAKQSGRIGRSGTVAGLPNLLVWHSARHTTTVHREVK